MSFSRDYLSERGARKLVEVALGAAKLPELSVSLDAAREGNTRFANNGITTTGDIERVSMAVTASVDGRSATARGTPGDRAAIVRLVREAEEMAGVSPVDPEHMPPLGAQRYPKVAGRDADTAAVGAPERAGTVARVAELAKDRDLMASGFLAHADGVTVRANRAGLFAYQPRTSLELSTTFRTRDGTGSGYRAFTSHRAADLDPGAIARAAADKAEMSRAPASFEPGRHVAVLEAQAVADLLVFLIGAMSTRSADEGRSFFSNPSGKTRVGEKLFDPRVTLFSDPAHIDHPAAAFDGEGAAQGQEVWVEGGVLRQLTCSRYWAKHTGATHRPRPSSLHMAGEGRSVDELVAEAGEGLLVSRFFYNRMLEPRSLLVTGLTRDGTFRIKGGKIDGAVNNFRYNESPINMLARARALGAPERVDVGGGLVVVVPPVLVEGFEFASRSDAV